MQVPSHGAVPALAAFAGLAVLALAAVPPAHSFPTKPVRILVGFAPGGITDVTARIAAQRLGETWGQQVLVENRAGASGLIAAEAVARAAPDGYTMMVSPQTTTVVAPLILPKVPVDPQRELACVSVIGSTPQLLVVHPALPVKTFADLVAHARANVGKLAFGSGGIGSSPHMGGALLSLSIGAKMIHVPYKGEIPAMTDVIGGSVPMMFVNLPIALPHVQSGKLRALAITSLKRSPLAPEFPTVAESGIPGFDTATWSGLYLPSAASREVIARLSGDLSRAMNHPEARERMAAQGIDRVISTPDECGALIRSDITRWARVVKEADIRAE